MKPGSSDLSSLDQNLKIKKSLRYSILDGAGWAGMSGFGEFFFNVFAVFLGASNLQISLLTSLPASLGSLSQFLSQKILSLVGSRKKVVCCCVFLQALVFVPIALVYFMGVHRINILIGLIVFYMFFGMMNIPAWNSWMGDLVNINEKGRFFGKRSRITGLVSFLSFIVAGLLLQRIGDVTGNKYQGFIVVFGLAMLSRFFSLYFLAKKYEPDYYPASEEKPAVRDFLKDPKLRNFTRLVAYISTMNFCMFISAPFFAPYMMRDLGFDFKTFTIVVSASAIVRFFTLSIWGRLCDIYGTRKVLFITGFLMPVIPILWLFGHSLQYLVLIQMYNGFIWAGFEISSFNYIYDTTRPTNRVVCVSYFNMANGMAMLLGGFLGAFIVGHQHWFTLSSYLAVFVISGVLRYLASFVLLPRLKEERKVRNITYGRLLLHAFSSIPATEYMFRAFTVVRNSRLAEDAFGKRLRD